MSSPSTTDNLIDLNMRQGIIWASRFLTGSDITDDSEIARCVKVCSKTDDLIAHFLAKRSAGSHLEPLSPVDVVPGSDIDMRQGVIWAHRIFLNRNPLDQQAVEFHLAQRHTPSTLRQAFMLSDEFRMQPPGLISQAMGQTDADRGYLSDKAVVAKFQPFCTTPAAAGSFADFIGVTTRCAFLPPAYATWSGTVGGPPGAPGGPMHDEAEWVGTLRSVLEAKDEMTVVELGAGWAPWLVACVVAGKKVGLKKYTLVGVEGDPGHNAFARQHFIDNGIDPDAHQLIEAVVGVKDGVATFPRHTDPRNNYGAEASYVGSGDTAEMVRVRCIGLETLLSNLPIVDILHCDIQGSEGEVLSSAAKIMDQRVRRIVIGTHAREVEATLHTVFSTLGWKLEHDSACEMTQLPSGRLVLGLDGAQVWKNQKLI
jgi:FkbM family methyltransferase